MPRRPPGSDTPSVWLRPAGAARQAEPAFSRAEITQVAIELADQHGLGAVSMRRIASRIGSAPTSLYWYFSDKSQLYELMVDAVVGETELPQRSGDWRADLVSIARATRVVGRRHPWLAQLAIPPVPGPLTRQYGAAVFQSLDGLGLDPKTQAYILAAVNNYIVGFLQRETGWWAPAPGGQAPGGQAPGEPGPGKPAGAVQQGTSRSDGAAPTTADTGVTEQHLAARASAHSDESFAFGLDCLLDGIAERIARTAPADEGAAS